MSFQLSNGKQTVASDYPQKDHFAVFEHYYRKHMRPKVNFCDIIMIYIGASFVLICLFSCTSIFPLTTSRVIGMPGGIFFDYEEHTSFSRELSLSGASYEDLLLLFSIMEIDEEELLLIKTDIFHNNPFYRVRFRYINEPNEIVSFYCQQLEQHGWKMVRSHTLLSESTQTGGDWVVVYMKDEAAVRIHIMGYGLSTNSFTMPRVDDGSMLIRYVNFDFIGVVPEHFFGCGYWLTD